MSTLAQRLALAIRMRGVTQADLVRAVGVKSASVSNWFTGETKTLRAETLLGVSNFLRVPPAWLAGSDAREPDWNETGNAIPDTQIQAPSSVPASIAQLLEGLALALSLADPGSRATAADLLRVFALHPDSLPVRKSLEALLDGQSPGVETKAFVKSKSKTEA